MIRRNLASRARAAARSFPAVTTVTPGLADPFPRIIYAGEEPQRRSAYHLVPWHSIADEAPPTFG